MDDATLDPDEAFGAVGHEIRIDTLRVLGEADEPLAFSEVYDRMDVRDSARFNYHLDKLRGQFVRQTDDGYELRAAGERVVEAVLSGVVTSDPRTEPTEIDHPCPLCGSPIEVAYHQERLVSYCTSCDGLYGGDSGSGFRAREGYLGYRPLPPAGLRNRSPAEARRTANTWNVGSRLLAASGVCPRCSAACTESVDVCTDHDPAEGTCDACGSRYAVTHQSACTNCIFSQVGAFVVALLSNTELLSFLTARGVNPVDPSPEGPTFDRVVMNYDEEILNHDPLDARFTFSLDGDCLTLRVDDSLSVTDVTVE